VYRAPQRYAIPAARIAVGLVQHASRPLRAWEQLSEEARAATTRTRSRCRAGLAGLAAWLAGLAAWLAGLAAIGLDRPDDPRSWSTRLYGRITGMTAKSSSNAKCQAPATTLSCYSAFLGIHLTGIG
jgi:hypothetical protein